MMGIGMGFGGIGLIFMLLFWGVLILGGVGLFRQFFDQATPKGPSAPAQPSAREILAQRYARGEISREEYLAMLEDLR